MKSIFFVFIFFLLQNLQAQTGSVELMAGDKYLHYQHSISQSMKPGSKWGWQHIATFIKRFRTDPEKGGMPDELMNQGYLTFRVHTLLSVKAGLFYTNAGGYQPTAGLQFFRRKKDITAIINPRLDIRKNGSFELFTMLEFTPSLTRRTRLYTRMQAMTNITRGSHTRSYQMLRVGLTVKGFQVGGGLTLDEYGTTGKVHFNSGLFIRRIF